MRAHAPLADRKRGRKRTAAGDASRAPRAAETGHAPAPPFAGAVASVAVPGLDASRPDWEFVAPAVHQLRTPLTSILSFTELLLAGAGGERDRVEWTGHIRSQAFRMRTTLNSMLSVSELRAGGMRLRLREVDLALVCAAVIRVLAPVSPKHEIRATIPAGQRWAMADPARTEEILCNLVDNAIKYSPGGGEVHISAAMDPSGQIAMQVTDFGVGLPESHINSLFAPFHRGREWAGMTIPGTGLGLYVVRSLVEAHGGRVSVESRPGAGSTFRFTLPAAAGSDRPCERQAASVLSPVTDLRVGHPADTAAGAQAGGDFVGFISYELRAPLTPLLAAAELLADPAAPAWFRRRWLRRIRGLALRMKAVTDTLLSASRLELGGVPIERRRVDLAALLSAVLGEAAPLLDGQPLTLEMDGAASGVRGDRARLEEVLRTLVEAAARRSIDGGGVRLRARSSGVGEVSICACFNDAGGAAAAGGVSGTAAAPFAVRVAGRLVELQGGRLEVRTGPDSRACFHVTMAAA